MIRANSRLRRLLDDAGIAFIEHATGAIHRILPHVQTTKWNQQAWAPSESVWTSSERIQIRMTVAIGPKGDVNHGSLSTLIERRSVPIVTPIARRVLDTREHNICRRIADRISEIFERAPSLNSPASILAITGGFDEYVIARHLEEHHGLKMSVSSIFEALHTLAEQSYENKSLTFGCILDPNVTGPTTNAAFPRDFLRSKKYKALSDGFRTAYHVSTKGTVLNFIDLERFDKQLLTEKHYYPYWAKPIASASRAGKCGIALSRQGDILVFDEGTLRFSYRFGRWQYWNHAHLVKLIRDRAKAQKVPPAVLGRVVGAIYRAALDVSFRRSGGLFIILHNRGSLRDIVRKGDTIADPRRSDTDLEFDAILSEHTIQSLPRAVAVELASLDGAVVLANSGRILAYGAVLKPRRAGRLRGTEGSRTKAAIGASNYGLAIKISSDGEIAVYYEGREFITI